MEELLIISMFIFHKKKASWKNNVWGIFFVFLIFPMMSYAGISIVELLPNPAGDDTLGEYIEIRNTGCNSMDIGWYHIFDASNKTYIFPDSTVIASHENIRLPYSMTKIALNNSGIESVTITDSWWTILNTYTYSGTQQDDIVILISSTDEDCSVVTPVDISTENDNTEIVDSGTLNTWLLTLDNTEIIIVPPENNTGTTESGDITLPIISTGSNYQSWIELSLSGTIDIVSTNTSITLESWSVFSELPTSTGTVIFLIYFQLSSIQQTLYFLEGYLIVQISCHVE